MNIAMFGGSFNPIHLGHIKLIKAIVKECDIQKLILVPTGITPHKSNKEMVSDFHRFNMCKLATDDFDFVEVSDIEIKREGKSFTYITINSLKELYPKDNLHLIVGADMFMTLQDWKNPDVIFKNAKIIAIPRDDVDYNKLLVQSEFLNKLGAECYVLKDSVMDVSSSEIRNKIGESIDVSDLLSPEVLKYINDNDLYKV